MDISNNSSNWIHQCVNPELFHTVLMTLEIILILFIVGGNTLTILTILCFKHLRIASYVMIGALSLSDLLVGAVYTPLLLVRLHRPNIFEHKRACLVIIFFGQSIVIGNTIFQATLSLERFYAVQFPFHYHMNVTVRHNLIWSISLFLGIVFVNSPVFCGIDLWHINGTCYAPTLFPSIYVRMLAVITGMFLIVGLLAFVRVLVAELNIRRHDRRQDLTDLEKQSSAQSTLLILAYAVSMCLSLPHVMYHLWGGITNKPYDPLFIGILHLLDGCNSAGNCLIYGLKNRKFRMAYRRLLGIKSSQVDSVNVLTNDN